MLFDHPKLNRCLILHVVHKKNILVKQMGVCVCVCVCVWRCPHNNHLGYFHNWRLSLCVGVWSGHISKGAVSAGWILRSSAQHNKKIVTLHSLSLQHPNPNKHITSTAERERERGREEDNSTAAQPHLLPLFLTISNASQNHSTWGASRAETGAW